MAISNDWAFQRSFLRKTYNKEVQEYFKDVPEGDEANNTTGRAATRNACLIGVNDSRVEAYMKMHTFRYVVQRVHLRPDVYGIPIDDLEESVNFSPVVHLYFYQDAQAVTPGKDPVRRQISFRLPDETTKTMNPVKARELARKIKNEFALNNGYRFDTGKIKATYAYHPKFRKMTALVRQKPDGREIITKVLSLFDQSFDADKLTFNDPEKSSVTNPVGQDLIYGKQRGKRRWRPIAIVRFQWASLHIEGMGKGIILVDRSARFPNPLERA